mmetsp:Transcript_35316/g.77181  ORF Transcript_35316/g.77181 Transcript_35316/m.77181 type:complete len:125 (+) Transcript_35316:165-539(+)
MAAVGRIVLASLNMPLQKAEVKGLPCEVPVKGRECLEGPRACPVPRKSSPAFPEGGLIDPHGRELSPMFISLRQRGRRRYPEPFQGLGFFLQAPWVTAQIREFCQWNRRREGQMAKGAIRRSFG